MKVAVSKIKPNPTNPRIIKDGKFQKLVKSIQEFPEMLDLRPIVVDEDMVVLGGNMRLKACIAAGLKEVPIKVAESLTSEQKAEFIIKDNASFGEWDWDLLANEWEASDLSDWGIDVWNPLDVDTVNRGDENSEWVGMPDFEAKDTSFKIIVHFDTESDREEYAKINKMEFLKKEARAWSTRWPYAGRDDLKSFKYE
jgi:hypothetical protein